MAVVAVLMVGYVMASPTFGWTGDLPPANRMNCVLRKTDNQTDRQQTDNSLEVHSQASHLLQQGLRCMPACVVGSLYRGPYSPLCCDAWDTCIGSIIPATAMAVDFHDKWVLDLRWCGLQDVV